MTLTAVILLLGAALTVAGVAAIVRHHMQPPPERKPRGTEPGQGDTLVYAKERTAFFGTSNQDAAGRMTRVTKDPQEFAKAMMPGKPKS